MDNDGWIAMDDDGLPVAVGNELTVGTDPAKVRHRVGIGNDGTARQHQIFANFLDDVGAIRENHQGRLFRNCNYSKEIQLKCNNSKENPLIKTIIYSSII